jgi:hypothetical protein
VVFELVDQRDSVNRARSRGVEDQLVVGSLGVDDDRYVVAPELKHLGGEADAFGVARAQAAVDLDAKWHRRGLRREAVPIPARGSP